MHVTCNRPLMVRVLRKRAPRQSCSPPIVQLTLGCSDRRYNDYLSHLPSRIRNARRSHMKESLCLCGSCLPTDDCLPENQILVILCPTRVHTYRSNRQG